MIRLAAVLGAVLLWSAAPVRSQEQRPLSEGWRGSVCYEIFVRSFADSDGDGIGDLRGLIDKLPYLNDGDPASGRDLGVTCLWLMPVAQSPSYHGYDVSNYYQVNRDYGTNEDFKRLMVEAHRRGIRVLVDLVLNHMSSEHPAFKSALLDRASPYRDWFLWSPTQRKTTGWSVPAWHRVPDRDEYYYGIFWQGMPDLNLANQEVTAEAKRIARFWLEDMGVDGFRFDAVGLFFEDGDEPRHGPGTHPWLRDYAAYIRQVAPASFTVGELWDSIPMVRSYYPDQLDAYFAFPVADALIDAVRSGSGRRLGAVVQQVQDEFPRGRWGSFLRNHDQTRTMTELRGDVPRAKLAATLLLTLPGIPFIYYGEEIGMTGAKPDPRLRTPMPWNRTRGVGFTTGQPWEPLQPDSLTANVEAQDQDAGSLLNHYRRLIRLRGDHPALGSSTEFVLLDTGTDSVLAYLRQPDVGQPGLLVLANLGASAREGVVLSSPGPVLLAGRYAARVVLRNATDASLRIGRDGRIRGWSPVSRLEPLAGLIFELIDPTAP